MTGNKIAIATFILTLLALAACSSSVGGGAREPNQTTAVVPPGTPTASP